MLSSLMVSIAILLFTYIKIKPTNNQNFVFKCSSDVVYDVVYNEETYTLDALYILVLNNSKQGFLHISGVVRQGKIKNDIDRVYYFDYMESKEINMYTVNLKSEKIRHYDSVDSDFFHAYFLPDKPGSQLYVEATEIANNTYYFKGASYPFFICTSN